MVLCRRSVVWFSLVSLCISNGLCQCAFPSSFCFSFSLTHTRCPLFPKSGSLDVWQRAYRGNLHHRPTLTHHRHATRTPAASRGPTLDALAEHSPCPPAWQRPVAQHQRHRHRKIRREKKKWQDWAAYRTGFCNGGELRDSIPGPGVSGFCVKSIH